MKFFRPFIVIVVFISVAFSFNSCKKITEDQIINGLWKLNGAYISTSLDNYLDHLPLYTNGNNCCIYKLDFERDGVVFAYYITYDSINNLAAGNWKLNSDTEINMKVGTFIDGTFTITKPTLKHWKLTSDHNHIKAYDGINPQLDTTYTQLDMQKI